MLAGLRGKCECGHPEFGPNFGRQSRLPCLFSVFAEQGRWGERTAYDHIVQSAVGMTMMQGLEGQDPVKVGFPVVDTATATGTIVAQAILAALLRRFRTGQGACLDISMAQSALQLMWPEVARAGVKKHDAPRVGNRGFSGSPGAACFRCEDGWLATAANTFAQFRRLGELVGLPQVPDDPSLIDQVVVARGGFVVASDPARLTPMRCPAGAPADAPQPRLPPVGRPPG